MTISKKLDRFATGAALVMAVGMMPQIATAEVTLKVADTFPPGHYIVETGTTYWMDRVTELTDGEVKFQYFGAGQLGSLRDMFSMVQTGVVDIGPPITGARCRWQASTRFLAFSRRALSGRPLFSKR